MQQKGYHVSIVPLKNHSFVPEQPPTFDFTSMTLRSSCVAIFEDPFCILDIWKLQNKITSSNKTITTRIPKIRLTQNCACPVQTERVGSWGTGMISVSKHWSSFLFGDPMKVKTICAYEDDSNRTWKHNHRHSVSRTHSKSNVTQEFASHVAGHSFPCTSHIPQYKSHTRIG